MVNAGGPSRGCVTCIQRKIRCDRQRPTCGQCTRSKRDCGGYRNEQDIIFRDETSKLQSKYMAASSGHSTIQTQIISQGSTESLDGAAVARPVPPVLVCDELVVVRSPKLDAEHGLTAFFANNFVCGYPREGTNLFWMPGNFSDLLNKDSAKLGIQSAGAMALARLYRSAHYYREAQKLYGRALLSLATSMAPDLELDRNAALVTTMFLSFFEILASDQPSPRQSWMTHLGGLGALLKNRRGQLSSSGFGARMMLQSRSQAILNALQTQTPVAEEFRTLSRGIQPSLSPNILQSDSADMLLIRLAALQARCRSSEVSNDLRTDLVNLDGDLQQWTESVHPSWYFVPRLSERPSRSWWDARHDLYPVAVIAHVWNKVRAARIIIHDLTREAERRLSLLDNTSFILGAQQTTSCHHRTPLDTLQNLVRDVCATIPPFYRPSSATAELDITDDRPLLGTTYWLLWPMEVVGSMGEAPPELIEWLWQCLDRIHETTGIVKAQLGARRLRERYQARHRNGLQGS